MSVAGIVTQLKTVSNIVCRGLTPAPAASGGYFVDIDAYRPKVKYKFKGKTKEEKKVAKILEGVTERQLDDINLELSTTSRDLEIALRINLELQGLIYKNLYMEWIRGITEQIRQQEQEYLIAMRKKKKRKQEEELILILLH